MEQRHVQGNPKSGTKKQGADFGRACIASSPGFARSAYRVQELDPRIPHGEEAETAVALRDWKTARVLFRHLLEIAPDDVRVKINFAVALMNGEGDFAAARTIFETIPYPRYDAHGQPIWDDLFPRFRLLMLERDYAGAERLLADFPLEEFPEPVPGLKIIFLP